MDPTVLRVSTNRNKVLLEVGDVFAESLQTIHLPTEEYSVEGADLGNQYTIKLMGTVAEATERAQYIFQGVRKDDGPPPIYWQVQATDPSGKLVCVSLIGTRTATS